MKQTLTQRQRVNGEKDSVNKRMPSVGLAGFNSGKITARETFAAQRAKAFQLPASNLAAAVSERLQERLGGKSGVKRKEFAALARSGVTKSGGDGGDFDRREHVRLIGREKRGSVGQGIC